MSSMSNHCVDCQASYPVPVIKLGDQLAPSHCHIALDADKVVIFALT